MLFAVCMLCMSPCTVILHTCCGSMARIKAICRNGHERVWQTQPMMGQMPQGNLDIAAAILFSGSTASKAINMMRHIKIPTITTRTFLRLQKFYLIPAIFQVIVMNSTGTGFIDDTSMFLFLILPIIFMQLWNNHQKRLLDDMEKEPSVRLGGDGRYDSSGHLAKYMSYSFLNMKTGLITVMKLVQVSMAHMLMIISAPFYYFECSWQHFAKRNMTFKIKLSDG